MTDPSVAAPVALVRRLVAETVGTGALVTVVVGSGIAAQRLSPTDTGLQLLENSTATALGLAVLIAVFAPISGAHFNPVVTAVDALLGLHRHRGGLAGPPVLAYTLAQIAGALGGSVLANAMFDTAPVSISTHDRSSFGHLLGEVVATTGLITVVFTLARTGRSHLAAPAVGAYIGAAYWFTSSTSFANPAVTLGRILTDTFAGINPTSALAFIAAQIVGAGAGLGLVRALTPTTARTAEPAHPPRHADPEDIHQ